MFLVPDITAGNVERSDLLLEFVFKTNAYYVLMQIRQHEYNGENNSDEPEQYIYSTPYASELKIQTKNVLYFVNKIILKHLFILRVIGIN